MNVISHFQWGKSGGARIPPTPLSVMDAHRLATRKRMTVLLCECKSERTAVVFCPSNVTNLFNEKKFFKCFLDFLTH